MKSLGTRKPQKKSGMFNSCYLTCGAIAFFLFLAFSYTQIFMGLRRVAHPGGDGDKHSMLSPMEAAKLMKEAGAAVVNRFKRTGAATATAVQEGVSDDEQIELDLVNERGHYPKMEASHYAQVNGMEPWERPGLKVWDLHVFPEDEWYDRAKKATDQCDLELTHKTQGAENGLEDKVVWVTALFDLKRGEAGMGDFQRGMDEYYRRFQTVLDRGFEMVIYIPTDFEEHLRIDRTRIKVIYMNATDLKWYFPYYERLQQIRLVQVFGYRRYLRPLLQRLSPFFPLVPMQN